MEETVWWAARIIFWQVNEASTPPDTSGTGFSTACPLEGPGCLVAQPAGSRRQTELFHFSCYKMSIIQCSHYMFSLNLRGIPASSDNDAEGYLASMY